MARLNFSKNSIKCCNKDSDKRYILEVDVKYPKHLHDLQSGLPFFLERMQTEKCGKLAHNLHDKEKYAVYISTLK